MARHSLFHSVFSAIVVAALGVADYYGYAVFGESPEQQQPGTSAHTTRFYHK